jgi:PTH1 family peptidyl-tRNA hydrolase
MKLIIGLGNPGKKYALNRHNVGFLAIDTLKKTKLPKNIILKKTNVFMNNSGSAVKKLTNLYALSSDNLYIIHDDLDLPLGQYKIHRGRGPKDHQGLLSIEKALGTIDFWRIRIGVDARDPQNRLSGEEYVLQNFSPQELTLINQVFKKLIPPIKSL